MKIYRKNAQGGTDLVMECKRFKKEQLMLKEDEGITLTQANTGRDLTPQQSANVAREQLLKNPKATEYAVQNSQLNGSDIRGEDEVQHVDIKDPAQIKTAGEEAKKNPNGTTMFYDGDKKELTLQDKSSLETSSHHIKGNVFESKDNMVVFTKREFDDFLRRVR